MKRITLGEDRYGTVEGAKAHGIRPSPQPSPWGEGVGRPSPQPSTRGRGGGERHRNPLWGGRLVAGVRLELRGLQKGAINHA
jgi:hypothetical protein